MSSRKPECDDAEIPEALKQRWISHSSALLDSFRAQAGSDLLARSGDPMDDAERLFNAPFVVVSHGTEVDPILNYGNRTALRLWEMTADAFMETPSRLTAEPMLREAREHLLQETARRGYLRGYEGVRVTSKGQRFRIHDVIIWNVIDASGRALGQAATFARWTML